MISYKLVQKAPVFSPYQVYLEWLALLEALLDASLMTQACFGFTICIKQIVSISGKECWLYILDFLRQTVSFVSDLG